MVTISIWHWLIVAAVVFFIFVLPAIAVARENSGKRAQKREYIYWMSAFMILPFALSIIGEIAGYRMAFGAVGSLIAIGLIYPAYQRVTRRARDVGMGKAIAYWSIVPVINMVPLTILIFKPSVGTETAANGDTATGAA